MGIEKWIWCILWMELGEMNDGNFMNKYYFYGAIWGWNSFRDRSLFPPEGAGRKVEGSCIYGFCLTKRGGGHIVFILSRGGGSYSFSFQNRKFFRASRVCKACFYNGMFLQFVRALPAFYWTFIFTLFVACLASIFYQSGSICKKWALHAIFFNFTQHKLI